MSTPPFVDLPDGVLVERWTVRGTGRAVMHAGLAGAQEWVVLVPGYTGSKEDFIAVLPALVAAGVGAITFDHAGQHESDGSADAGQYALDVLGQDLALVVAQAGRRTGTGSDPHLVGHSFGGLVLQEALVAGRVTPASITFLCSGPGGLPAERWGGLPDIEAALESSDLAEIWRLMREADPLDPTLADPVADFLERRWLSNHPVHVRAIAGHLMRTPDLRDRLRPALAGRSTAVMWGESDDVWPVAVQQRWAEDLDVAAIELGGVGHSPNAEAPELLVDALLRAWGRRG